MFSAWPAIWPFFCESRMCSHTVYVIGFNITVTFRDNFILKAQGWPASANGWCRCLLWTEQDRPGKHTHDYVPFKASLIIRGDISSSKFKLLPVAFLIWQKSIQLLLSRRMGARLYWCSDVILRGFDASILCSPRRRWRDISTDLVGSFFFAELVEAFCLSRSEMSLVLQWYSRSWRAWFTQQGLF